MEKNRIKQLISLTVVIALLVVHFLWGKAILTALASTVFFWFLAALLVIFLVDTIGSIIKNTDASWAEKFFKKKKKKIEEYRDYEKSKTFQPDQ